MAALQTKTSRWHREVVWTLGSSYFFEESFGRPTGRREGFAGFGLAREATAEAAVLATDLCRSTKMARSLIHTKRLPPICMVGISSFPSDRRFRNRLMDIPPMISPAFFSVTTAFPSAAAINNSNVFTSRTPYFAFSISSIQRTEGH